MLELPRQRFHLGDEIVTAVLRASYRADLTAHHGDADATHIADEHRMGKQIGEHSKFDKACSKAHDTD
ncbi:Uncharacterised protein [Mycobacteroides abscessus subsp. abscessus]|nr:Uncharacterised protein [Mycobacteroides abscessus subsp. abscessus]